MRLNERRGAERTAEQVAGMGIQLGDTEKLIEEEGCGQLGVGGSGRKAGRSDAVDNQMPVRGNRNAWGV